ncbi:hypothetical protein LPJ66_009150 [Kickxella alabastrina]|uniref:Uncharacterized protein n=1 Tax=Kickxella alabastrina TaxID=61397 RepID=A0ACC1I5L8_9FUNG|nr:hypothetical protein LPJ66_009150 [Kickxella alabastrina]
MDSDHTRPNNQPNMPKRKKSSLCVPENSEPQFQKQLHGLETGSPTERLLARSSNYTQDCELYPRAMRDTINQHTEEVVVGQRDPSVIRKAERTHDEELQHEMQRLQANPKEALSVYPAAARSGSSLE